MSDMELRDRISAALEDEAPVDVLIALIAQERVRELQAAAEPLRNIGRRCRGNPGDRHRRHIANQCAELLIRRSREIARRATSIHRQNGDES